MYDLKSRRIFLRPWNEEDAPRLYDLARDPDIGPRAGWPIHTSVENSREIIRNILSAPETYALMLQENDLPVGSIGLKKPEERFEDLFGRQLEIGYWLGKKFWGCGLMPEAVNLMLKHGFEDLNCAAIWCAHYDFNDQSRRVIEKCGFHYRRSCETTNLLGETNVTLYYAMTKEEWRKR